MVTTIKGVPKNRRNSPFFGTPFKYFLVSRSPEKLQVAAKEIEETFDVKTKILAIDFTKDKDIQDRECERSDWECKY